MVLGKHIADGWIRLQEFQDFIAAGKDLLRVMCIEKDILNIDDV